jgi:hypothetical protein
MFKQAADNSTLVRHVVIREDPSVIGNPHAPSIPAKMTWKSYLIYLYTVSLVTHSLQDDDNLHSTVTNMSAFYVTYPPALPISILPTNSTK